MPQVEFETHDDAIDRLRKGPKSWANLCIVTVNILIFLLVELTGSSEDVNHMIAWGAAFPPLIGAGAYYRLFTSMFLHFGFEHLFNNMLLLVFIGDYLERTVGRIRYLVIYLLGGMGGSLLSWILHMHRGELVVSAGASGAVFAVIGAMLWLVIRHKGRLEDLSLQRLLLMAALSIYFGFSAGSVDNAAHIGGLLCGFFLCMLVGASRTQSAL